MDWKLIGILAASALITPGCDRSPAQAQDWVRAVLKDPDSARFSEVQTYGDGAEMLACGMVNAKNSMGGYVGNTPFMISEGWLHLANAENAAGIRACCQALYRASTSGQKVLPKADASGCPMKAEGMPLSLLPKT